jgi:Patatin-like phospholipase
MDSKTEKYGIPLHLCQVFEEEFENVHAQPDERGEMDASVEERGAVAAPDWEFHGGHVSDLPALAGRLRRASDEWQADGGDAGGADDLATYLALRYPGLWGGAGGSGASPLDILNHILHDRDEGGGPNAEEFKFFRRVRFEHLALRDETRGLLELVWADDDAAAFDDAGGERSDLVRFRRLLLEDAFPDEIRRVYDLRLDEAVRRVHALEKKRTAVCFSGGGIRSGTFALGVVQSLARRGLLKEFDYLSTVSGGGYVGAWLTAWIHRHRRGLSGVAEELDGKARASKTEPEPEPLRHLRDFSNFITPRTGLLSADSWAFIVIYIRNLLLNWVVLIPLLASVLMVPRVANAVVLADPAWRVLAGLALLGGLSIFLLKPDRRTFGWVFVLGVLSLAVIWIAQSRSAAAAAAAAAVGSAAVAEARANRVHYVMGTLLVAGALLSAYALAFMRLNRPSNSGVLRPGSYWDRRRDQNSFLWMCLLPLAVSAASSSTAAKSPSSGASCSTAWRSASRAC